MMRIIDILGMSLSSLWRRKTRTILTVLGVVIGSCAIIVMVSLGLGMNNAIGYYLTQYGDLNVITVYGDMWVDGKEPAKLTEDVVKQIQQYEHIEAVFPKMSISGVSLCVGRGERYKAEWSEIYAVYPEYMSNFGYTVKDGAFPEEFKDNYIIFGQQTAYNFYDSKRKTNNMVYPEELADGTIKPAFFDPLTDDILLYVNDNSKRVDNNNGGYYQSAGKTYEYNMKCVAVLDAEHSGGNWDSYGGIFISMDLANQLIKGYNKVNKVKDAKESTFSELKVYVDDIDNVASVEESIEELGFTCNSMESARKSMQGQLASTQALLGGLAAISLFVAAIGITNTMIMSIYERTREIGVMKVLGCNIRNIRQVFLIEAACIGCIGGIVGTILSYIISFVFNNVGMTMMQIDYMYTLDDGTTLPVSLIPFWLVLVAIAFSTMVGVVSGFYPANRAVKISALEAIKNE